jgi:hypothetical protein
LQLSISSTSLGALFMTPLQPTIKGCRNAGERSILAMEALCRARISVGFFVANLAGA